MAPLLMLSVVVAAFLVGLFSAFWYRSFIFGLILINVGTVVKIMVSMTFGIESCTAVVLPSLSSLALCAGKQDETLLD